MSLCWWLGVDIWSYQSLKKCKWTDVICDCGWWKSWLTSQWKWKLPVRTTVLLMGSTWWDWHRLLQQGWLYSWWLQPFCSLTNNRKIYLLNQQCQKIHISFCMAACRREESSLHMGWCPWRVPPKYHLEARPHRPAAKPIYSCTFAGNMTWFQIRQRFVPIVFWNPSVKNRSEVSFFGWISGLRY